MRRPLTARRVLRDALILYAVLAVVKTQVMDVYHVPSNSMRPAIEPGDMLLVDRLSPWLADPVPGEVILFRHPRDPGRVMVKRVAEIRPGGLHVLGDNAAQSLDSREGWLVAPGDVIGRALLVVWSRDPGPGGPFAGLRPDRIGRDPAG
jgi:nickel-type superoxide dismutase maturation protease